MRIQFNQTLNTNNYVSPARQKKIIRAEEGNVPDTKSLPSAGLSLVNFPNISFRMNADMRFLLDNADKLCCAYSRREMISPYAVRGIYSKLAKRPNAQSAINLLVHYEDYMHDIEAMIFDLFKDSSHKGKKDFQAILTEHKPEALERLKSKQIAILNGANDIIETMSEPVAAQVKAIRDDALQRIENGSFGRKAPLELIKKIKASGGDLAKVIKVYQTWYKTPSSSKDIDAFIVKYSKEPHEVIARRLISPSVATVEHIQPSSRGGDDDLSNFLLVSARFNNDRDTMPLDEYIMLNPEYDITHNLQRYMDDIIEQVQDKRSRFSQRSWYPEAIRKAIWVETSNKINLNTDALKLTKQQIRQNSSPQRLSQKYIVSYK